MTLELAAWIPVVSDASAPPGESVRRIVVVEQEPAGGLPDRLSAVRRLAASPRDGDVAVVDEAGAPVLGTTAVALALRVEVVDRTDRPPPGHNLHEDGPRRRLDDPLMWRILRDIAAIEAPPAAAAARGDHPPIRPPKRLL